MKSAVVVARLWPRLKPYRSLLIYSVALGLLAGLIGAPVPLLMRAIVDKAIPSRSGQLLVVLVLGIVVTGVLRQVITYCSVMASNQLQESATLALQRSLLEHLLFLPASYHSQQPVGRLASLIANDARRTSGVLPNALVGAITNVSKLLFGLIVLFHLSPKLTLITLLMLPLAAIVFATFGRRARKLSVEQQQQTSLVYGHVYEIVAGVETVRTLGIHKRVLIIAFGSLKRLCRAQMRSLRASVAASGLSTVAVSMVMGGVLYVGASQVASGLITLGTFFAFNTYAAYLFGPALGLMGAYLNIQASSGSVEAVFSALDQRRECVGQGPHRFERVGGQIEFRRVSASYADVSALHNASFSIPAGAHIGLVGRSGAGKTTLLRLIAGIMFPTEGDVLVGNVDTRGHDLGCLRANIAYVPQHIHVFAGTMRDNIRLGRPGASDDDIDRLVDRLGITNIVTHLENGIDTVVGVNGATLSGGERQLIGICRAMLRNAPIVLLDESTAALDTTTDAAISYSLQELARGRTVIVIAHRLSTLRYVDRVIYMDAGCIVGMDSHDELHRSIVPYRILCSEYLHLPGSSVQSAVRSTPEVVLS